MHSEVDPRHRHRCRWSLSPWACGAVSCVSRSSGGKSTTTTTTDDHSMAFNDVVSAPVVSGSLNTVRTTTTDHGAVAAGTDLSKRAVDVVEEIASDSVSSALDFGNNALSEVSAANERATDVIAQSAGSFAADLSRFATATSVSNDERMLQLAKWGTGAGVLLVMFMMWSNRRKSA